MTVQRRYSDILKILKVSEHRILRATCRASSCELITTHSMNSGLTPIMELVTRRLLITARSECIMALCCTVVMYRWRKLPSWILLLLLCASWLDKLRTVLHLLYLAVYETYHLFASPGGFSDLAVFATSIAVCKLGASSHQRESLSFLSLCLYSVLFVHVCGGTTSVHSTSCLVPIHTDCLVSRCPN